MCLEVVYDENDVFICTRLSSPSREEKEPKEERALDMMIPSHTFRTIERMPTIQTLAGP
jgi:hypothetical protein